jgi:5-methylcytosine-specific restriction protein A
VLVPGGGRCPKHANALQRESDARRGSSTERGYDSRWRKARRGFLRSHPLCAADDELGCKTLGRIRAADTVDHIVPHRGDATLFWDRNNWRSMCKTCHDRKTAREDGGFGRLPTTRTKPADD